ncbi:unnamed protein product [Arctogadus glacialis]
MDQENPGEPRSHGPGEPRRTQITWTRRTQENPDPMDQVNPGEPRSHGPGEPRRTQIQWTRRTQENPDRVDLSVLRRHAKINLRCTLGSKRVDRVVGEPAAQRLYAPFVTLRSNQTPL